MIGSGLRKLAAEKGLKVASGVAYGSLHGYCATLSEGSGNKTLVFSTRFTEVAQKVAFTEHLQTLGLDKEFKLMALEVQDKIIQVVFLDTIGTMKRIAGFIDRFIPILEQYGASKLDICPECGTMLTGGSWKLVNGIAIYVHEACAERIRDAIQVGNEERLSTGSYLSGAVGAFLGATGGAAAWAGVMLLGYVTSLVGFLIGFLAERCYNLFRGKKGVGKIVILILAVIFGVLLGNAAANMIAILNELSGYGFGIKEGIEFLIAAFTEVPEVRVAMIKDTVLGLLYAGLGVAFLISKTKKEVTGPKFIDLE